MADTAGAVRYATPSAERWLNGGHAPSWQSRVGALVRRLASSEDDYGLIPLGNTTLHGLASPALWCDQVKAINLRPAQPGRRDQASSAETIARFSEALRGPVSKLGLSADMLVRGRPDRRDFYREVLSQETDRLTRLIGNLTLLSQVMVPSRVPHSLVSMAQLVRAIRETVSAGVGQNDPPPQVDSAPTALKVRGNPRMIGRAVLNLITGIPHATTAAGGVRVHLGPRADASWISITLRSPGFLVSGEELLRLFEPFVLGRLDLELVVVRGIIGHYSGLITVQERDGARFFRLWLPAHGGSPPQVA